MDQDERLARLRAMCERVASRHPGGEEFTIARALLAVLDCAGSIVHMTAAATLDGFDVGSYSTARAIRKAALDAMGDAGEGEE